jgi:glyoxylase-like metal-dependent hydrolase (beta-lactamase superfamily II)
MSSEPKKPQVHGIFHKGTSTVTYVITDPTTMATVILDSVLDYDAASGRTSNQQNDKVVEYCRENSLDVRYILETHVHGTFGVGVLPL